MTNSQIQALDDKTLIDKIIAWVEEKKAGMKWWQRLLFESLLSSLEALLWELKKRLIQKVGVFELLSEQVQEVGNNRVAMAVGNHQYEMEVLGSKLDSVSERLGYIMENDVVENLGKIDNSLPELFQEVEYLRSITDTQAVARARTQTENIILLHMHRNLVLDGATSLTDFDEWIQVQYEEAINVLPT